jgi:hypothetical protein
MLDLLFIFNDRGAMLALRVPTACATAGLMLALLFIFIDPWRGGTDFLCCAKESKQRK